MKKMLKNISIVFFISLVIELLTSPLRSISFTLCSVVTFALYFVFTVIALRKFEKEIKPLYILLIVLIGCSALPLPFYIIDFKGTAASFLDFSFHLMGIIMGYWYYKSNRIIRFFVVALSVVASVFLYFQGYQMWIHKLSYGNVAGKVEQTVVTDFELQTAVGEIIKLSDFKEKYLILDFGLPIAVHVIRSSRNYSSYMIPIRTIPI